MALSVETKVGLFFLVGVAILGYFTFRVANVSELVKPKAYYKVSFPSASGLDKDAVVCIAGMRVGKITNNGMKLKDTCVEMTLEIDRKYPVHTDAIATVAWGGLIGNRYIDISLGKSKHFLEPGTKDSPTEIPVGPTIELTDVFSKINAAATDLQDLLKSTDARSKIQTILENVDKASTNIAKVTEEIREHRGTVGKLIGSEELYDKAQVIADNLKGASADVRKLLADNDQRLRSIIEKLDAAIPEAKDAFSSIKKLSDEAHSGKGPVAALLNDEKMAQDLRNSLGRLGSTLDRLDAITKSIEQGQGLVARLVNDPQMADDVRDAVKSLREVAERVRSGDNTIARLTRDKDLYEDVKKLLDDARETLRSVKEQIPVSTFASLLLTSF
jgi:phospholipid/cholesterol/gamma-HCH transport system substrate-binding protein